MTLLFQIKQIKRGLSHKLNYDFFKKLNFPKLCATHLKILFYFNIFIERSAFWTLNKKSDLGARNILMIKITNSLKV